MKLKRTQMILSSLVISLILLSSACSLSPNQDSGSSEAPVPLSSEDIDSLVMLAKFDLALKTGADIEKMDVESVAEFNFSDASLGVPEVSHLIRARKQDTLFLSILPSMKIRDRIKSHAWL